MQNITSLSGDIPTTPPPDPIYHLNGTAYGSSKAALNRLTEGLASEYYADSIVANALAPVKAVLTEGVKATLTEDVIAGEGILEPVEAMAEAALVLCTSDRDGHNGKVHKSLTLLDQLGLPVRTLDGRTLLGVRAGRGVIVGIAQLDPSFCPRQGNNPIHENDAALDAR